MAKDNKNCPVCFGKGKVKTVKTVAHIGNYYLGKEEYNEPFITAIFKNLQKMITVSQLKHCIDDKYFKILYR